MSTESTLPLAKALRTHAKTSGIHPSTAGRWSKGVRKPDGTSVVRLRIEFVGSRLFLSHAEIDRFLSELNGTTEAPAAPRSPTKRLAASEKADAELQRIGA